MRDIYYCSQVPISGLVATRNNELHSTALIEANNQLFGLQNNLTKVKISEANAYLEKIVFKNKLKTQMKHKLKIELTKETLKLNNSKQQ